MFWLLEWIYDTLGYNSAHCFWYYDTGPRWDFFTIDQHKREMNLYILEIECMRKLSKTTKRNIKGKAVINFYSISRVKNNLIPLSLKVIFNILKYIMLRGEKKSNAWKLYKMKTQWRKECVGKEGANQKGCYVRKLENTKAMSCNCL